MAFGDFTVTRSTVKRVLNSSGVLAQVAINTPAFEFNTDGTYRGLLVEPAATNLALRSAEFEDTVWTTNALEATVSANAIAAPDGATTADAILATVNNTEHFVQQRNIPVTSGATYTWSVFLKKNGYRYAAVALSVNVTASTVVLDFDNGTASGGTGTVVQSLPNGWFRLSATTTATATGNTRLAISLRDDSNNSTFVGDITKGVYAWGAQLETGSVATSYIPTVASTVTRTADSVTLTGASSLIGQTEGTLYAEFEARDKGVNTRLLTIDDGSADNNLRIAHLSTRAIFSGVTVATSTVVSITSASTYTGIIKVGFAYATNDFNAYVNGSSVGTDTSGTIPATSRIILGYSGSGTDYLNGWIRSIALFPTRLANATLATLTT